MKKILPLLAFCLSFATFSQIEFSNKFNVTNTTGEDPWNIESGNLDGDDLKDIVVITRVGNTIEWYKNDLNNSGNFIKQPNITTTLTTIIGVAIADLNNDGYNDIVASGGGNNKLAWYPNNTLGGFGAERIISSTLGGPSNVKIGLIDDNNSLDIAVADYGSNATLWFANDGSGNFSTANTIASVPGSGPIDIDLADFDGDGDLDVVIANYLLGTVELYDNKLNPNNSVSFVKYTNTVSSGSDAIYDVSFADVNDDDILDIIKADLGGVGDATYYTKNDNTISTTFTEVVLTTTLTRVATATVADFNNDGYNDVVITNGETLKPDVVILESNNDGTFKAEKIINDSQKQIFGITINDFGNDGDLDIATISYQENALNFFLNSLFSLGIGDENLNKVKMYPNPVNDNLNFSGLDLTNLEYSIFNNLGQKIITSVMELNNQINVSVLNTGIYFLKLSETSATYKFIKE